MSPWRTLVQTKWRKCKTVCLATTTLLDTTGSGGPSNPLLDLSGLTRKERVMVQASINNERDFDRVAEHLIIQHPRIHLRESQKRAKGKGKDGSEDELKFDVARRMKGNDVRSRCVLQDFATTVKDDAFAPTSSPVSVTGLLLHAAWHDLRVETGGLPPKGQEGECWVWRLHEAMNGMRTASRDFAEFPAGVLTECMGFTRIKLEQCLFVYDSNETRVVPQRNLRPWRNSGYTSRSSW